jgi:hypothetical protein
MGPCSALEHKIENVFRQHGVIPRGRGTWKAVFMPEDTGTCNSIVSHTRRNLDPETGFQMV